ncbi:hypothetical protein ACFPPD_18650 [Cohnella suwonensis]|uniref:Uncharacterized protein n=1 Tax=Cohnella suwonensis TaxID=696072 RepID=A0ABW0LZI1_9BACL
MIGKAMGFALKACGLASIAAYASIGLFAGTSYAEDGQPVSSAGQPTTSAATPLALTSAPIVEPNSVFNPNDQYLDNGTVSATVSGSTLTASAATYATQTVDTIGITFYLQKWNGTSWDTVSAGTMKSATSRNSYSTAMSYSLTAGYYYRARTVHWVMNGAVYEEGTRTSNSVLAS